MASHIYDWKRFWCPREGHYSLADDGFLVDPDSGWGRYYAQDVVSFESIERFQCLVLLGEPGSGKTTTVEAEWEALQHRLGGTSDVVLSFDLREFSTDHRLASKVFDSPAVQQWKSGNTVLHLGFDSLDESLLRIDNIAQVLRAELRDLDAKRLRLRTACRTADWPAGLEATLREKWGSDNVGVFELVPLRKVDVILAAGAAGIEPTRFLETIRTLGIAPLANRPVTLRFLIDTYAKSTSLPTNRTGLYLEGCRRLAEESSASRRDAGALGELTAAQRLEVASRLAAVTVFSNRYAFWTGLPHDMPLEDASVEALVGGHEGADATRTSVTREAILETLDTGLFNARGAERLGWSHQSYAEFLAARYIHNAGLPCRKTLQFVLHPDGTGKVIPQLRETAAWLASLDPEVFRALVQTDPETLLRSDIAAAADADRAELASNLLLAFDTAQLIDDRELRPFYGRLKCPNLWTILRPYLRDTAHNLFARHAAVCMAEACELHELHSDLVAITLDQSQPSLVRITAAATIALSGDSEGQAGLRPLALGLAGDDPEDQLKGCGLQAAWPNHLTTPELFAALTPRKRPSLFGTYWRFLESDPIKTLAIEDFPAALRWALGRAPSRPPDSLSKIASQIFIRALQWIESPEISAGLAAVLVAHWDFSLDIPEFSAKLLEYPPLRHRLAQALYPLISAHRHGALILMDACALRPDDVPWLLGELETSDEAIQKLLAWVIVRCLDPRAVDTFDSVLHTAGTNAILSAELAPLIATRTVGSAAAQEEKTTFERINRYSQAEKIESPSRPDAAAYQAVLSAPEPGRYFSVWELGTPGGWGNRSSSEPLSGWRELDDLTRGSILEAAQSYLKDFAPRSNERWWRNGQFPYYALAAHSALVLLEQEAPEQFERLGQETWERWLPIVVLEWSAAGIADAQLRIVETAYKRATETFLSIFDEIVDGENTRSGLLVLHHLDGFSTPAIADHLRNKLQSGTLKPAAYRHLLAKLLDLKDDTTRAWAQDLLLQATTPASRMQEQTIGTAIELIAHTPDAAWSVVWPIFQADETFAAAVLAGFQTGDPFGGFQFVTKLAPEDVAEFFVWFYPTRLALSSGNQDEEDIRPAFPTNVSLILSGLAHRATPEATRALRRIEGARPQLTEIHWHLRTAEELVRRNTWIPLSPDDLLRTVSNASARFIRNGSELLDVLVESLERLEESLQGEAPAAFDLWNDAGTVTDAVTNKKRPIFKPKDELAISDYVKRHLDRDLKGRGVVVNREVEIRRPMGGAPGERTDVHVTVAVPTPDPTVWDKVTVVIEVKGIWNPELGHAMQTQLVERYLKETGFCHGLYLVGWFACPQWDSKDQRSKCQPYPSLTDAQDAFNKQAASLSNSGRHLRSVVLNAALR